MGLIRVIEVDGAVKGDAMPAEIIGNGMFEA